MSHNDYRAIVGLSWPILVAQLAVMVSGATDTILTGHYGAVHLAAIGIGSGIYVTMFVGLMGVIQALSPIIARHYGAGEHKIIGLQVRQGLWLALGLSLIGMTVLSFPASLLALAHVPPDVSAVAEGYLRIIAWGLPFTLITRVFYAFTPAVGRARPVMVINIGALFLKVPISYVLLHGLLGLPEMGASGCALGTVLMYASMCAAAMTMMLRDPFYAPFDIPGPRDDRYRPHWPEMKRILALGLPIAAAMWIEVTSFTMIAMVLAPLGAIVSGAHQIVANLATIMFMMPLSIGIGTQVLIGQRLGKREPLAARRVAFAGVRLSLSIALVVCTAVFVCRHSIAALYTSNTDVMVTVGSLIGLLAVFHFFDAIQGVAGQALRGYQRTIVPTAIYAAALWGVGLIGGWWLTWGHADRWIGALAFGQGGPFGMWAAATVSLMAVACGLMAYLAYVSEPDRAMAALPRLAPAMA
jgi:MATE family multidrug resistance protein